MKYKCKHCGNITDLKIVVPVIKCVDCDQFSVYTRKELVKLMEDSHEA